MYTEGERSGKIRIPSWMEIKISNNGDGLLDLNSLHPAFADTTSNSNGEIIEVVPAVTDFGTNTTTVIEDLWIFNHSELKNFYFGVQNNTVISRINKLYRSSSIGSVNNNILTMTDASAPTVIEGEEKIILVLGTE